MKEGDHNIKYFHSQKEQIIHEEIEGCRCNSVDPVLLKEAVVELFQKLLSAEQRQEDHFSQHIIGLISLEDNEALTSLPTKAELNEVVFSLRSNSVAGSDGFNGTFYKFQLASSSLQEGG
ncbi:hypothetical protein ACH5RR_009157 [Cinchona calisaya]|uniref:Uncharacterized protein n=1 Tax=Cinchona calisaya TaxID=153742 RepID=A0ABD3ADD2_9GENT